jgi:hypothetical protein
VRSAVTAASHRPPARRRVLVGADPELARHMEVDGVPARPASTRTAKVDWAAVAAESAAWGRERGITVVAGARA